MTNAVCDTRRHTGATRFAAPDDAHGSLASVRRGTHAQLFRGEPQRAWRRPHNCARAAAVSAPSVMWRITPRELTRC